MFSIRCDQIWSNLDIWYQWDVLFLGNTIHLETIRISLTKNNWNTSIGAPWALTHHLQFHTHFKIQIGHLGPQNVQRGPNRCLPLGYWSLWITFFKIDFSCENSLCEKRFRQRNTSLVAKGALAHRLQRRNAAPPAKPKMADGVWKGALLSTFAK